MKTSVTPDNLARSLRGVFASQIPKTPMDGFFLSVWELCKVIQEQCDCEFLVAEDAIIAHFPELFSDFWEEWPFHPADAETFET